MAKYPHAELMVEFAKDAMETEFPNLRWEYKTKEATRWTPMTTIPMWDVNVMYRRKPKTESLNGYILNKGISCIEEVPLEQRYLFIPDFGLDSMVNKFDKNTCYKSLLGLWIERGLVYLNEKDARHKARVMIGLHPTILSVNEVEDEAEETDSFV